MPPRWPASLATLGFLLSGVAAEYDEERSITFAKLAGAADCHKDALEAWSCGYKCIPNVTSVKTCQGYATHAFVGKWEDGCVVGFQGSGPEDLLSFVRDLQSATGVPFDGCDGCMVGKGFLSEWRTLEQCVKESLREVGCSEGSKLRMSGHSLGGAVSSLAMIDLTNDGWQVAEAYDFGKPRVGDAAFVLTYNRMFESRAWRVTRMKDPIPQLPPKGLEDFEHTEPEIYYAAKVAEGYQKCTTDDETNQCIEQYNNIPADLLHILDHLSYMGVNTGHAGCVNDLPAVVV